MKSDEIKTLLKGVGIKDIGVCRFESLNGFLPCAAAKRLPNGAKSVIVFAFPYKVKENPPDKISRYAAVGDYHEICKKYLEKAVKILKDNFENEEFVPFIDNSPIKEVYAAALAGLGVIGENGLLITEEYGSFVFLGEIVTTQKIQCKEEIKRCLGCNKCKEVCPKDEYGICLSALSQKKGELTKDEERALKTHSVLWGCDICQAVCPLNENAKCTYIKEFTDTYRDNYTLFEDITGRAYAWRGNKVIERNAKLFSE